LFEENVACSITQHHHYKERGIENGLNSLRVTTSTAVVSRGFHALTKVLFPIEKNSITASKKVEKNFSNRLKSLTLFNTRTFAGKIACKKKVPAKNCRDLPFNLYSVL